VIEDGRRARSVLTPPAARPTVTDAIRRFLDEESPDTPCLVLDRAVVRERYARLGAALPTASIYFAMKACPDPAVLGLLVGLGAAFDVASRSEIDLCLAAGAPPDRIAFGTTVKKQTDIAYAYQQGVRQFAFDSGAELAKLADAAPGSTVVCRFLADSDGADWPLSRKFGCEPRMAVDLLLQAREVGLDPAGVSFHVGSQQRQPARWDPALAVAAQIFEQVVAAGVELRLINLGGGFPARYSADTPDIGEYGAAIEASLARHFDDRRPVLICEPGRYLTAEAGVLRSEVVLVSRKTYRDEHRWVYLDVGRFSGLAETEGEAIRYELVAGHDGPVGPVILAGPTCDSVDVLYERHRYELPLDLQAGDTVDFLSAGAYTAAYASGFNGFKPLRVYCL
jgi:ornithine decarboxylase